jgi:hypothetical protein
LSQEESLLCLRESLNSCAYATTLPGVNAYVYGWMEIRYVRIHAVTHVHDIVSQLNQNTSVREVWPPESY